MIKIANILKEDFKWNWTSTRTDRLPNSTQSKPESPVKNSSDKNNNLQIGDILQNRLQNTKNHVLYSAKSYFENYDYYKKKYEENGKNYDLQSFRNDLIRSIKNNIQEYFFDKLKRKYNISLPNSEQYFQQITPAVDKIISKLPNNSTSEQVADQYRHFRFEINRMFERYEELGG